MFKALAAFGFAAILGLSQTAAPQIGGISPAGDTAGHSSAAQINVSYSIATSAGQINVFFSIAPGASGTQTPSGAVWGRFLTCGGIGKCCRKAG